MTRSQAGLPAALLVVLCTGIALVLGLAVIGGAGEDATSASILSVGEVASATCPLTGSVAGLTADQAQNADTIVAGAMATSGEDTEAAQIALMAAMTESRLENLDHGGGGSLGLFQQRPLQGWGSAVELMDPTYATVAFVRALLAVPGWQQLQPWKAAQAVQRSSFRTGSNYQATWARAGKVLDAVLANANTPGACGQGTGAVARSGAFTTTGSGAGVTRSGVPGGGTEDGLPPSYAIPPGTPPEHAAVVQFALAQLGKPYVWGAAGPDAYDCSGLTMAAWATVTVTLVHYTGDQQDEGVAVTAEQLIPGDLVLTPGSDSPGPGIAGHVGIYLGDGLVVSALDPANGVVVQSWSAFVAGGLIALRDPAPGM